MSASEQSIIKDEPHEQEYITIDHSFSKGPGSTVCFLCGKPTSTNKVMLYRAHGTDQLYLRHGGGSHRLPGWFHKIRVPISKKVTNRNCNRICQKCKNIEKAVLDESQVRWKSICANKIFAHNIILACTREDGGPADTGETSSYKQSDLLLPVLLI